ncbi:MAG TPA: hypothetical protein VG815_06950 [Chloroflexota bacterium]|nr:hypothetical protein [Chloroflexota bacterium]
MIGAFKSLVGRGWVALGNSGDLWQPKFYDRIVRHVEALDRIVDYILENPIRRGLAEHIEGYPNSGMPDPHQSRL